jgi:hyperosmotically inducible periplasmic protein
LREIGGTKAAGNQIMYVISDPEVIIMNRRYGLFLGISALASALSFAPCTLAQTDTSANSQSSATAKDEMTDTAVTAKVKDALASDKDSSPVASAIQVQTTAGVVTLSGNVDTQATAEYAQMVVARLAGVRDVVNDLKYPGGAAAMNSAPPVMPPAAAGSSGATTDNSMSASGASSVPGTTTSSSSSDTAKESNSTTTTTAPN